MLQGLQQYQDKLRAGEMGAFNLPSLLRRVRRLAVMVSLVGLVLVIVTASVWFFERQAKISRVREEVLPEIRRLV